MLSNRGGNRGFEAVNQLLNNHLPVFVFKVPNPLALDWKELDLFAGCWSRCFSKSTGSLQYNIWLLTLSILKHNSVHFIRQLNRIFIHHLKLSVTKHKLKFRTVKSHRASVFKMKCISCFVCTKRCTYEFLKLSSLKFPVFIIIHTNLVLAE